MLRGRRNGRRALGVRVSAREFFRGDENHGAEEEQAGRVAVPCVPARREGGVSRSARLGWHEDIVPPEACRPEPDATGVHAPQAGHARVPRPVREHLGVFSRAKPAADAPDEEGNARNGVSRREQAGKWSLPSRGRRVSSALSTSANIAQLVEQRFRKAWVVGSIPTVGSTFHPLGRLRLRCQQRPSRADGPRHGHQNGHQDR